MTSQAKLTDEQIANLRETVKDYWCNDAEQLAIIEAALDMYFSSLGDARGEPVAWIQSNHLGQVRGEMGQSVMCRLSNHQLHSDFIPLYTNPIAADAQPDITGITGAIDTADPMPTYRGIESADAQNAGRESVMGQPQGETSGDTPEHTLSASAPSASVAEYSPEFLAYARSIYSDQPCWWTGAHWDTWQAALRSLAAAPGGGVEEMTPAPSMYELLDGGPVEFLADSLEELLKYRGVSTAGKATHMANVYGFVMDKGHDILFALRSRQEGGVAGKLWLWRNFVDGRPEYWAFNNPFPVHMDNDDPQTLGEPCGYALVKPSRVGRTDIDDDEVVKRIQQSIAASTKEPKS